MKWLLFCGIEYEDGNNAAGKSLKKAASLQTGI
jgi:hypothetical protein